MSVMADENIRLLISALLGGGLFTGIGQFIKARADARKVKAEVKNLEGSTENAAEAQAASAMNEALQAMRHLAADANTARDRAEDAEERARTRAERVESELRTRLDGVELTNRDLCSKVEGLERDKARTEEIVAAQTRRITRMEEALNSAYQTVRTLVSLLRTHAPDDVPDVDYSIFDVPRQ